MYIVYTCACKVETFYSPNLSTPSINQGRGVMDFKNLKVTINIVMITLKVIKK